MNVCRNAGDPGKA